MRATALLLGAGAALAAALPGPAPVWAQAAGGASARSPAGIQARDVRLFGTWLAGTFTNREQVYFTAETDPAAAPVAPVQWVVSATEQAGAFTVQRAGTAAPDTLTVSADPGGQGVRLGRDGRCFRRYVRLGDQFVTVETAPACASGGADLPWALSPAALFVGQTSAAVSELRKARPFTCWAAIPKREKKADGSTDWWGGFDIRLHDQGGRAWFATDEPTPQRFGIEIRNVVWPYGNNRPSLTLYVYEPADEKRAVAYSWADNQAERVGINTRAVQVSCTRDGTSR